MGLLARLAAASDLRPSVVQPGSRTQLAWATVVLSTVAMVACFYGPLDIAFGMTRLVESRWARWAYVAIEAVLAVASALFVADIGMKMFVLGYESRGAVVLDRPSIRRRYLVERRWRSFVPDVLAALPLFVVELPLLVLNLSGRPNHALHTNLTWVRCFLHLAKLHDFFGDHGHCVYERACDTFDTLKVSLFALLGLYLFAEHSLACLWFIVMAHHRNSKKDSGLANSWIHSLDDLHADAEAWDHGTRTPHMAFRFWIASFYWGSTAGDGFTSVNTRERCVGILGIVVVVNAIKAYIISSINDTLENQRGMVKQTAYRLKIDGVNRYLRENRVPSHLCQSIRVYYKEVWLRQHLDFTESTMLRELPESLRRKAMRVVMTRSFQLAPVTKEEGGANATKNKPRVAIRNGGLLGSFFADYFQDDDDDGGGVSIADCSSEDVLNWANLLSAKLRPMSASPGEFIVLRGDSSNTDMFLLKSGVAEVVVGNKGVVTLTDGAYFGDILLLGLMSERTASIRAKTYCELFSLSREDLRDIFRSARGLRTLMMSVAKKRLRMSEAREEARRREKSEEEERRRQREHEAAFAVDMDDAPHNRVSPASSPSASSAAIPTQQRQSAVASTGDSAGSETAVPYAKLRELADAVKGLKESVAIAQSADAHRQSIGSRLRLRKRSKIRSAWGRGLQQVRKLREDRERASAEPPPPTVASLNSLTTNVTGSETASVLSISAHSLENADSDVFPSDQDPDRGRMSNPLATLRAVRIFFSLWTTKAANIERQRAEEMKHVELYDDDDMDNDTTGQHPWRTPVCGSTAEAPPPAPLLGTRGLPFQTTTSGSREEDDDDEETPPRVGIIGRTAQRTRRWIREALQAAFGTSVFKTGLIHPDSPFSEVWNAVQLVSLLIVSVYVPLRFAFTPFWRSSSGGFGAGGGMASTLPIDDDDHDPDAAAADTDAFTDFSWIVFEDIVQTMLALDVAIKLVTGYHVLGSAVMSGRLVRRKYVFSWSFVFDVLACLPVAWYLLSNGAWLGRCVVALFVRDGSDNRILIPSNDGATAPGRDLLAPVAAGMRRNLQAASIEFAQRLTRSTPSRGSRVAAALRRAYRTAIDPYVKMFPLLKLYELPRRGMAFQDSFADAISSTLWSTLIVLFLYLLCTINALACTWFSAMAYFDADGLRKSWIGEKCDDIQDAVSQWMRVYGGSGVAASSGSSSFTFESFVSIYIACFYWAASAGDAFDVTSTSERLAAIFAQLVVVEFFTDFFIASFIGAFHNHDEIGRRRTAYRTKIDSVNEWMHENNLPFHLRGAIRRFYRDIWTEVASSGNNDDADGGEASAEAPLAQGGGGGGGGGGDGGGTSAAVGGSSGTESALLGELPEHLRGELLSHVVHRSFRYSPFFRYFLGSAADCEYGEDPSVDKLIELVASSLTPLLISPGEEIIRQGDFGDVMYLIKAGRAEVTKNVLIERTVDARTGAELSKVEKDPTLMATTDAEDESGGFTDRSSRNDPCTAAGFVVSRHTVVRRFPLVPGSYFGEFAVMAAVLSEEHFYYHGMEKPLVAIGATRRSASVRALSRCELFALHRDSLEHLWRKSARLRRCMIRAAREAHGGDDRWWLRDEEGNPIAMSAAEAVDGDDSATTRTAGIARIAAAEGRAAAAFDAAGAAAERLAGVAASTVQDLRNAAASLMGEVEEEDM